MRIEIWCSRNIFIINVKNMLVIVVVDNLILLSNFSGIDSLMKGTGFISIRNLLYHYKCLYCHF